MTFFLNLANNIHEHFASFPYNHLKTLSAKLSGEQAWFEGIDKNHP